MYLRRIALASARRHASLSNVGQAGFRTPASSALKMPVASMSTRKSWIPESEEALQKVTTNAMIHEVAEQQKERASRIVPWFLKSMPSAYFKQISIDMQSQHVQAIASLKELTNSDLSLRMEADTPETNTHHVTFITSGTQSGLLHSQIKKLVVPAGQSLSNVNVFSSLDDSLALNVFSFQGKGAKSSTTRADAARIFDYLAEVQAGTHVGNANVPVYSEADFGAATMDDYLTRIQPSYARQSNARRFLIQKNLYEQVRGSEGARVHLEQYMPDAGGPSSRSWVTIAAANVLPEVLLRLCSALISRYVY
ncbi:hypothetical protein B484DRAFT_394719 [Ochromonadaceae sp. CCMP2298]|nr:hypothetical protein B484DRAFT_394719 [Ochromonadaceae sp. CCMP2298]